MLIQDVGLFDSYTWESVFFDARDVMCQACPRDPVYLFSRAALQDRVRSFRSGFPGMVSYAVKANPEQRVTSALAAAGIGHFDVASIGEVEAIAGRHPRATLHFNNPVKAFEAIEAAYRKYGVRSFALDEITELDKIRKATGSDRKVMYSVRFKLGHESAGYDFGSKFGTSPDNAVGLLQEIASAGARPALTFHPGSQCADPGMYERYLEAASQIIRLSGVAVELINVGGGFPEQYANTRVPALEDYFRAIRRGVARYFDAPPRLMCEPGRAMVASSVSLLTRVIHVRDDGRTLFLNDGVYGGMQEQSLVDLHLPLRAWRNGRRLQGPVVDCHAFGPTCDPVDRLSRPMALPAHITPGDYVEFGLLGAYGSATSTAFNGFQSSRYFNVRQGFGVD